MKKKKIIVVALFYALSVMCSNILLGQDISNGKLDIKALYIPDFIVFKPSAEQEFKEYAVFLVSGTNNYNAIITKGSGLKVEMVDGKFLSTATDKSEIRVIFNISEPGSIVEIQKVKFVIDGEELYYNIEKSEWE